MLILRYKARISDLVRERIDQFCKVRPEFREVWNWAIWKVEFGMADKYLEDRGDGRYTVTLKHSPRYPIITLYLRFPEQPQFPEPGQVDIMDATFHDMH